MTKSQIDRLGARLRAGEVSDADLRMLDEYRRSFAGPYDHVMHRPRNDLGLDPTGRAAKSTFAILGKLRRESVRLSQIQDIAGCRVVVHGAPSQNELVEVLRGSFRTASLIDRRARPSHGYRAIHVVVTVEGAAVEIQVRTYAQQLWAEMSEKLSDVFGIEVKYGGGPVETLEWLQSSSALTASIEDLEVRIARLHVAKAEGRLLKANATELDQITLELAALQARQKHIIEQYMQSLP